MTSEDASERPAADGGDRQSALDLLLRRMQTESDFPALSEAIGAINRIASSDRQGVAELSNTILKDFALTNKLLRLANVAFYNHVGGGSISTISRAVVILGFDAVRSIALSLVLFDNLQNKGHAQLLKEEFIKVLYAGMLAREMAGIAQVRDAEEAFIGAMLHTLGRVLAMFYFPAETAAIRQRVETGGASEARAAAEVLGVSFDGLGIGVARRWGFPDRLVQSMKPLPEGRIRKPAGPAEQLQTLAGFANELCQAILDTPADARAKALAGLRSRFGDGVPLTAEQLAGVLERSMREITQFAQAVNVNLRQSEFAGKAAKWAGVAGEVRAAQAGSQDATAALDAAVLHEHGALLDGAPPASGGRARQMGADAQSMLTSGLQDVGNSLIDDAVPLNDILRMILETIYTGMGFEHVVLCLRDGRHNRMLGRLGFGEAVQALIDGFAFSLASSPDVFLVALENNADILISDIDDPKIAARIPSWYRQHVPARTFALFPILVKGRPVGLIYADRAQPGAIVIPEKELSLLKSLRNQAVLAIRSRQSPG